LITNKLHLVEFYAFDDGDLLTDDVLDEYLMTDRAKPSARQPAAAAATLPGATGDTSQ